MSTTGKQIYSTLDANGSLTVEVGEKTFNDPTGSQVLVKMEAAPINPSDLIQISGNYGVRPTLPAVAGNEGLGRITEGEGEGQLVLLPAGQGTWVSEMVCDPRHLVPLPEKILIS